MACIKKIEQDSKQTTHDQAPMSKQTCPGGQAPDTTAEELSTAAVGKQVLPLPTFAMLSGSSFGPGRPPERSVSIPAKPGLADAATRRHSYVPPSMMA
jgi:hypothetical protein